MRSSENYNLNLVEGTDIVNPLVQDVPNYEAIDEAMFANKEASVGVATELKSGTVHAITRLNSDAAMFRFTATSKFEAGETFTVDGIQVTALLPDGTTLESGAYIIGSTVLCSLVGTLMTVYTTRTKVDDADKLDGHTADYYATKSALDVVDGVATAAGELAAQINTNLSELFSFSDVISANTVATLTANGRAKREITIPSKSGYTPFAILYAGNSMSEQIIVQDDFIPILDRTSIEETIINTSTSAISNVVARFRVLYIKAI